MSTYVRLGINRVHENRLLEDSWTTFDARDPHETLAAEFAPLRSIKEIRLAQRQHPQRPTPDADIVTYVHEGAMVYANPVGRLGIVRAGHFLFTRAAKVIYNELLDARSVASHLIQFYLEPSATSPPVPPEIHYFSFVERSAKLRLVMSLGGDDASLKVPHDLFLYSAVLKPGQHVARELRAGQRAWMHVVVGTVKTGAFELVAGDGVGFTNTPSVSVTATSAAEILLLDLGNPRVGPNGRE